jgi:hypothetical protein
MAVDRSPRAIRALLEDLTLDGESARFDPTRARESWADPDGLSAALFAFAEASCGRLASDPARGVALYADIVLRHRARRSPALVDFVEDAGWRSSTYAELDALASSLAVAWRARGVAAGAVVALALPLGRLMVVACLAAWRLGAAVAVLDGGGPLAIREALTVIAPGFVAVDPLAPWEISQEFASKVLSVSAPVREDKLPPLAFAPGAVVARVLSPMSDQRKPRDVKAKTAIVAALRDGALSLRLAPGRRLIAPLVSASQWYPTLLLAVFVSGATLVLAEDKVVRSSPHKLDDQPAEVAVLSRDWLALLEARPLQSASRWTFTARPVEQSLDWQRTRALFTRLGISQTPCANVLYDSGEGGALLVSASRPGSASARCVPVMGRKWKDDETFVLAPSDTEWFYAGTVEPRRQGLAYGAALALEAIAALPWCAGAGFAREVVDPCHARFVLCAFRGGLEARDEHRVALAKTIELALGERALPDRIEVFAGHPHAKPAGWIERQYRAGFLQRKQRDERFVALTQARASMAALRAPRANTTSQ